MVPQQQAMQLSSQAVVRQQQEIPVQRQAMQLSSQAVVRQQQATRVRQKATMHC